MSEPLELALSESTTVEIAPLNGYESMTADRYIGDDGVNATFMTKVYAICSLRKFNGVQVNPLSNKSEMENLAKDLTMFEMGTLMERFSQMASTDGDALKNE